MDEQLNAFRNNPEKFLPEVIRVAKKLSGYEEPAAIEQPVFTARVVREKYLIEKYFIKGEGDYVIPYLLFKPDPCSALLILYVNSCQPVL